MVPRNALDLEDGGHRHYPDECGTVRTVQRRENQNGIRYYRRFDCVEILTRQ